ncbi:PREDICTED: probable transcription factor At1g44810 [Camelina sativa]|uniref:Probable transcription factor At1g44810 n=1 Tax=Camelina sativa TaxID=90675 RepID=A0ABM0V3F8_CAMSA|nr:PREDICTED: probable transcription factor At1g44810 [Camelina sativa]
MAKKVLNPLEDPPTASSSGDEEVETSSGEEDVKQTSDSSFEEDDPKDPATSKTLKTTPANAPSTESEGSESESEPSPEKPVAVVTRLTTKPKKKEGNESTAPKPGKKRASEAGTTSKDMHVKKAKKAKKVSGDDEKKPFQRLWSEDDEISLLQGMIDFKAEKGTSPYDDMNGFFDMAKNNISFDVSKIQFGDKIRSLKKKYFAKQKKKGSLESSHDKKCLGLAKYIWVSDGMALESAVKLANGKLKKVESLKSGGDDNVGEEKEVVIPRGDSESSNLFEKSFLVRTIAGLGVDEFSVKEKWSKVSVETKNRIEEKLKLVEAKEYELLRLKSDILKEVAYVMTQGI